jgi:uncharacterized protein
MRNRMKRTGEWRSKSLLFSEMNLKRASFFLGAALAACSFFACDPSGEANKEELVFHAPTVSSNLKPIPDPVGFVNDFEHIFTATEKDRLDSLSKAIEKQSSLEIAVVTLDSNYAFPLTFDTTTFMLANKWGIGKKDKDNGILIGISKQFRNIHIQNGYGIIKVLTNDQTQSVIDSLMIPQFKNGHFYEGTRRAIMALYEKVK